MNTNLWKLFWKRRVSCFVSLLLQDHQPNTQEIWGSYADLLSFLEELKEGGVLQNVNLISPAESFLFLSSLVITIFELAGINYRSIRVNWFKHWSSPYRELFKTLTLKCWASWWSQLWMNCSQVTRVPEIIRLL